MEILDKIIQKEDGTLLFRCPGCGGIHKLNDPDFKPRWNFNGDLEKPTIRPSILNQSYYKNEKHICHSFITDGEIRFLNDCTHDLAGETVGLYDVNEENYNLDILKYY